MTIEDVETCPLCERPLTESSKSDHHLIPKSQKGKETVTIHLLCHNTIHATFTEKQLARKYSTIEALREQPAIQEFIAWVAAKPPDFYVRTKKRKR